MDKLQDRFTIVQAALSYLDANGHITYIRTVCRKYNKGEALLVYNFKFLIDTIELLDLNASLGNLVLFKPLEASEIFQEVTFHAVQELALLSSNTTLSQIAVSLRLNNLAIPATRLESLKDFSRCTEQCTYVKFDAVVIGCTGISKYTQSTKYVCPDEECEGNTGNKYIRVHTAGSLEAQTVRTDFTCCVCNSILEEDRSSRMLSDKLLAEVVPESSLQSIGRSNKRRCHQSIPVYVRDDLCEKVQIGQKYHIIGVMRRDVTGETVTTAVEANNFIQIPNSISPSVSPKLPDKITRLYDKNTSSPWAFVNNLVNIFASEVSPSGTYFKLKQCLILSIAALSEERLLHILSISHDSNIARRLMEYGQRFLARTIPHTAVTRFTGKVQSHKTAPYFIEGGTLPLATGGICYLGDLSRLKKRDLDQIQSVLSSNKIFLEISSKHTGGFTQQSGRDVHCQMWACVVDQKLIGSNTSKSILDGFGCAVFNDCDITETREETDSVISCHILMQNMEGEEYDINPSSITMQDLKKMFQYLTTYCTVMTQDANQLLSSYFQIIRKARCSTSASSDVPLSAGNALISLAHGHAKLSLRRQVLQEDAVMAIRIYEENLTARFGLSPLCVQPTSHIPAHCFENSGIENDQVMNKFHVQLVQYCGGQIGEE